MPTSDEFFDPGQTNNYKVTMMTDQLPAGMFDKEFSAGKHGEPTPEDMEAAAEAVRYEKIVEVKEFHVGTYDLSDKASLAEYKRDVVVLYKLQREKRGVISFLEKKFIMHEGKPKMTVHMEWYEYNLKVTDHMTGRHFKTAAEFSIATSSSFGLSTISSTIPKSLSPKPIEPRMRMSLGMCSTSSSSCAVTFKRTALMNDAAEES